MYIYKGKGCEKQGLKQKIEDDIRWAAKRVGLTEEEFGKKVEELALRRRQDTLRQ